MSNRGAEAYAEVLIRWLRGDAKRALVLLPHDLRPAPVGDVAPLEEVNKRLRAFGESRVHLLKEPFDAWDVKAIASRLDLAISGRMHLAIAAMGACVPTICVVYQGKFEGLMRLFELQGLTLSPEQFLNVKNTYALLTAVTQGRSQLKAQIASKLERVNALAKQNFVGL
jgi:polysaccharide pyruvyl transferase WcaK-like protein